MNFLPNIPFYWQLLYSAFLVNVRKSNDLHLIGWLQTMYFNFYAEEAITQLIIRLRQYVSSK